MEGLYSVAFHVAFQLNPTSQLHIKPNNVFSRSKSTRDICSWCLFHPPSQTPIKQHCPSSTITNTHKTTLSFIHHHKHTHEKTTPSFIHHHKHTHEKTTPSFIHHHKHTNIQTTTPSTITNTPIKQQHRLL